MDVEVLFPTLPWTACDGTKAAMPGENEVVKGVVEVLAIFVAIGLTVLKYTVWPDVVRRLKGPDEPPNLYVLRDDGTAAVKVEVGNGHGHRRTTDKKGMIGNAPKGWLHHDARVMVFADQRVYHSFVRENGGLFVITIPAVAPMGEQSAQ